MSRTGCVSVLWEVYNQLSPNMSLDEIEKLKRAVETQCILPNDVPTDLKDDAVYYAFEQLVTLEQAIRRRDEIGALCPMQGKVSCFEACRDMRDSLQEYIQRHVAWAKRAMMNDVLENL